MHLSNYNYVLRKFSACNLGQSLASGLHCITSKRSLCSIVHKEQAVIVKMLYS